MFRGREVQHPELGERLLRRLASDLDELGRIESQPNLDGRNMIMVMAPKKVAKEEAEAEETPPEPERRSGSRRERAARS
ncbi:hypothetical protein BH24ACT18_BH24ACT18_08750 [soil metagenome]